MQKQFSNSKGLEKIAWEFKMNKNKQTDVSNHPLICFFRSFFYLLGVIYYDQFVFDGGVREIIFFSMFVLVFTFTLIKEVKGSNK